MIRGIPAADYARHRSLIWPFLQGFAGRDLDGVTAEEMEAEILARECQVWAIKDFQALCITRVTRDAVRIERCAGIRRHEWQEELGAELKAWARALGKKRIVSLARPGWAGTAKKHGYREAHREFVLEV